MLEQQTALPARPLTARLLERLVSALYFCGPILALLAVWEVAAQSGHTDPLFFPAPSAVLAKIVTLSTAAGKYVIWQHLGTSAVRALGGFLIAALAGLLLGVVIGISPVVHEYASPILSLLLPIPAVAWTPILLIAVGRGNGTILPIIMLAALFPVLYNTATGVRGISKQQIWALQSMGGSHSALFFRVLIPGALPSIITGLKLGMSHAWRTLVAVEMLAAVGSGLGYMIFAARTWMDTPTMYAGVIILTLMGFAIEHLLFGLIERATIHKWYGSGR